MIVADDRQADRARSGLLAGECGASSGRKRSEAGLRFPEDLRRSWRRECPVPGAGESRCHLPHSIKTDSAFRGTYHSSRDSAENNPF
jgi:hypothetical protein